jgi:hypothetical protein
MPLPKHCFIYEAAAKAVDAFGERHHITARQHLAPKLGYGGANADIQFSSALNCTTYNPVNPKPLTVDHLAVLLRELGPDRRIILDAIAKECGGVFVSDAQAAASHDDVRDELLQISALAGQLSNRFLEYKHNDGVIDDLEAGELEQIAYETRRQLKAFEEMIKAFKTEEE